MTTVKLPGGETIWYKTTGTGAPFLQIHGSAFGHKNFAAMTPLMAEHFEVIDFDLPGYGQSVGADVRPGGMAGLAELVFEFLAAVGYERVNLHGTSFGAMIGLSLAAAHPEVIDKLVLSCFLARYDLAARMMRKTWKRAALDSGMDAVTDLTSVAGFARGYYERAEAQAQFDEMYLAFAATKPEAFVAGTQIIEGTDLEPLLPNVKAPTLLLAGKEDNMTPFNPAPSGCGFATIAQVIPGAELHVLDDCGHYLVLEQPEEATRLIVDFVNR
ncbi:alpha/beta fold hydrolase [Novosphingobium sp. Gsoil 351]|uniref:alpha/beta fold hydrolase n=1 Tax=Novosphingobium sp. Gsoil 351 TaxID=2675225 RepID=UPI0012B47E9E|nr:alpha/beta fold hydrolase [Novosphingobium sp. Gsoil 351]QGN55872.1 alpha/beta fold hydrolase [Novosphingobium sp. Gsoil 351]